MLATPQGGAAQQAGQSTGQTGQAGANSGSGQASQGRAGRGRAGGAGANANDPQAQGRRGGGAGAVVRPPDQRVPAPFSSSMERPIAMADNVWMSELTILEMRDLVRTYGYKTALIMNGTMESNGPYLTTGKHNHVLRVTGDAIARTLGRTLIAPIVMLDAGNPENTTQPGRLVLSQATLQAVVKDMATSLKSQGFTEIFLIGDSGSNQRLLGTVASELTAAWAGQSVLVAHIPEYYNYADVLRYQNEVLGKVELNKDLDGYHDDYYITSIIMNDSPRHVRFEERLKVNLDHINSLPIVLDEALAIGRKLIQFRADATVEAIRKVRAAR
jgi:creatinine amidohydrolase/Fe(II)-dependent formamide hydrolase-like protein